MTKPDAKPHFLKDIINQLSEAIPAQFSTFKKDFEKSCNQILTQAFAKLDLVTREEFETQTKVLARTRKKLEELEKKLKSMEKHK